MYCLLPVMFACVHGFLHVDRPRYSRWSTKQKRCCAAFISARAQNCRFFSLKMAWTQLQSTRTTWRQRSWTTSFS